MASKQKNAVVCLEGPPADVGRTWGQVNAATIRRQVRAYVGSGKDRDAKLRAVKGYREVVERIAPHWLEEAAAIAVASGVKPDEYVAYQAAKYRGINRPECFTYFSAPQCNFGNVTLFHKNRDNRDRPQAAYVKHVRVPGKRIYRFAATGDTSDMGTMMGVNEKGLASAADTGAKDPKPRFRGVMNPDLMRLILEQASTVDEAEAMIRRFNAERIYAGGPIATNWMFSDATGRAKRVIQFHERIVVASDKDGLLVMREQDRRGRLVTETLREARGRVTPQILNRLSRTQPVLAKTNISAMTAVVPPSDSDPAHFGYAHFAVYRAANTVYVPLYLGVTATPRPLMDGTIYQRSKGDGREGRSAFESLEADLEFARCRFEVRARLAADRGNLTEARRLLTAGTGKLAERVAAFLKDRSSPKS